MKHVIKKQLIELKINKKEDAFRLQQLTSEKYRDDIIPVLDRVFTEMFDGGTIFRIDFLEIDLGQISESSIENGQWADLIKTAIMQYLKWMSHDVSLPAIKASRVTEPLNVVQQWIYYMQHGRLHWSVTSMKDDDLVNVLQVLATDTVAIDQFRNMLTDKKAVVDRIVFQHDESFLISLMEAITAKSQKVLPDTIERLAEIILILNQYLEINKSADKLSAIIQLWKKAILYSVSNPQKFSSAVFAEYVIGICFNDRRAVEMILEKFNQNKKVTLALIRKFFRQQKKHEQSNDINDQLNEVSRQIDYPEPNTTEALLTKDGYHEPILRGDRSDIQSGMDWYGKDEQDEDGMYVCYAGLVLLHPFLDAFFKNTGIRENDNFTDIQAHQKTVILLGYLATGNMQVKEYELVVPKLLCGYPLQMPVNTQLNLTVKELEEADDLLLYVIKHWEILKNTSIAGLRETFLQRNGKLTIDQDKIVLVVERTGVDILLNDLPWNISMINLPWINNILQVDWV